MIGLAFFNFRNIPIPTIVVDLRKLKIKKITHDK